MHGIFKSPTVDDLDKKLKITEGGRYDAKNGIPPSNAVDLSKSESGIRGYIINPVVNNEKVKAQKEIDDLNQEIHEIDIEGSIGRIKVLPDETSVALLAIEKEDMSELVAGRFESLGAEAGLNLFKQENGLARNASYPSSRIMHWVIIGSIVLGETVLNGAFFSQGMERGLVGGLIAAFLITLVNVCAAFLVGTYCAPRKNHIKTGTQIIGWTWLLVYGLFLAWFCIAVGYYRSLIQINEDSLLSAQEIMSVIFDWELLEIKEFYGWLLVFFSMLIGIITTIKFYTADDIYPGYGKLDRKSKDCARLSDSKKSKHSKKMFDEVRRCQEKLFSLHKEAKSNAKNYSSTLKRSEQLVVGYDKFMESIQTIYNNAIQLYRKSNEEVRPDGIDSPGYFSNKETIDKSEMPGLALTAYEEAKENLPLIEEKNKEIPVVYERAMAAIQSIRESLDGQDDRFMQRVDGRAKKKFNDG